MNQPNTHIVYRNRAEHDFWEGGYAVPIFGGLAVGFVVFLLLMKIAEKTTKRFGGPSDFVTGAAAVVALCVAALTFHWLFI